MNKKIELSEFFFDDSARKKLAWGKTPIFYEFEIIESNFKEVLCRAHLSTRTTTVKEEYSRKNRAPHDNVREILVILSKSQIENESIASSSFK